MKAAYVADAADTRTGRLCCQSMVPGVPHSHCWGQLSLVICEHYLNGPWLVLECTAVDNVQETFLDTHVIEIFYLLLKIDYDTK